MSASYVRELLASDEFRQEVARQRQEWYEQRWEKVPQDAGLWLALVPSWTLPLAEQAEFPAPDAKSLLADLGERGLLDIVPLDVVPLDAAAPAHTPDVVYALKPAARGELLGSHLRDPDGRRHLRELAETIGSKLKALPELLRAVPATSRWAELAAAATNSEAAAQIFDTRTEAALDEGGRIDEVFNWIEAARPLADLLQRDQAPELDLAVQRAGRRLELFQRRERDARTLRTYLPRPEQDAVFADLLQPNPTTWAVHFLGDAGTGKTMLLRHIGVNLARGPDGQDRAIAARIDFDYLNPDYPDRAPGLLLWSFAQELRAYDHGSARRYFERMDQILQRFHRSLEAAAGSVQLTRPTAHPAFREALLAFMNALQALAARPGGATLPVVLILDTCEELARQRTAGEPRNLVETMRIVRALHDGPGALDDSPAVLGQGLEQLRVIFAGRLRLLSSLSAYAEEPTNLPPGAYLRMRLHELQGFTKSEATSYLRTLRHVPESYIPAILERCRGGGSVARWTRATTAPEVRWHPFDLKDFADWVLDDKPPTVDEVRAARGDRFLELRILRRLREGPIKRYLADLATLGHFDLRLLAVTCGLLAPEAPPEQLRAVQERELRQALQDQEWIEQRDLAVQEGRESRTVWKIEARLRARLRVYFRAEAAVSTGRQRAAEYLQRLTLSADLSSLDWTVFDATLNVLEAEPPRAVAWWAKWTRRALVERGPRWLVDVLQYVVAADGAAAQRDDSPPRDLPESWLRPLVLATYLACLRRLAQPASLADAWCDEVITKADRVPVEAAAANLYLRGLAMRVALTRTARRPLQPALLEPLWGACGRLDPTMLELTTAGALREALSALVDEAEEIGRRTRSAVYQLLGVPEGQAGVVPEHYGPWQLVTLMNRAAEGWRNAEQIPWEGVKELMALFHMLQGRLLLLVGSANNALSMLRDAEGVARSLGDGGSRTQWAHLGLPDDVRAHVLLRCALASYPALESAAEVRNRVSAAGPPSIPTGIDGDQLLSLHARLSLALGPIPASAQKAIAHTSEEFLRSALSVYRNGGGTEAPLAVRYAEMMGSFGMVDPALTWLREIRSRSDLPGDVLRHADRAGAWLLRRLRLRDVGIEEGGEGLARSDVPSDRSLWLSLTSLWEGERRGAMLDPPEEVTDPTEVLEWLHAIWWSTPYRGRVPFEQEVRQWLERMRTRMPRLFSERPALTTYAEAAFWLDLREWSLIDGNAPAFLGSFWNPAQVPALCLSWAARNDRLPVEVFTVRLRLLALYEELPEKQPESFQELERLARHIGLRRAGELALEEGELLRLRLLQQAVRLLRRAQAYFADCNDPLGILFSSTLLVLARGPAAMRETNPNPADPLPKFVQQAYETLRGQLQELGQQPPLPQLSELTQVPPHEKRLPLTGIPAPREMWPLLARLLVWIYGSRTPALAGSALNSWLLDRYGLETDAGRRLPTDFDGWFDLPTAFSEEKKIAIQGRIEGEASGPLIHVAKGGVPTLRLALAEQKTLPPNPSDVLPVLARFNDGDTIDWSTPGVELSYLHAAPLSEPLLNQLRNLAVPGQSPILNIQPSDELHGPCWEALVARAWSPDLTQLPTLPFRRIVPSRFAVARITPAFPAIMSLLDPRRDVTVSETGWAPLRKGAQFAWDMDRGQGKQSGKTNPIILHLVGTVVGEWPKVHLLLSAGNNKPEFLSASELALGYEAAALCVLQGPPQPQLSTRTTTDRYEAMLARMFAAQLHTSGIPAVLVLPPLESKMAAAVLQALAESLSARGRTDDVPGLLTVSHTLRQVVLTALQPSGLPDWHEIAYDLCLYLSDDWRGLRTLSTLAGK